MRRRKWRAAFGAICVLAVAAWLGCGSSGDSTFGSGFGGGADGAVAAAPETTGRFDNETGAPAPVTTDDAGRPCKHLQCNQVTCLGNQTTTLTGKVYDPAGKNPLYNALVYVPNEDVAPFDDDAGVTCDKCAGAIASGAPIVAAITGPDGTFTLTDVPALVPLPLVIQMGKWRRVVTLPAANPCAANVITDVEMTRLPKDSSEGHIPQFAITSGGADPFECLLLKIGLARKEFTLPDGGGRIHYYQSHGGIPLEGDASTPWSSSLWSDPDLLRRYDVVLFPCEGTPSNGDKEDETKQNDAGNFNVKGYLDIGGRLFITHYSYSWLTNTPPDFSSVANWPLDESDRSDRPGADLTLNTVVDQSFPKGLAFSQWLTYVDASAEAGSLPVVEWRHDVSTENKPPSQRWIYSDTRTAYADAAVAAANGAGEAVQHFTFNAPIEAGADDAGNPLQCGKVVFSDFHVSAGERSTSPTFPDECLLLPMSPQEKALEFMLFDLSACVQPDDRPLPPPPGPQPK